MDKPVLEPVIQAYLESITGRPSLFELGVAEARKAMEAIQSPRIEVPGTTKQHLVDAPITVFRPAHAREPLPVIVYLHGGGWVTGSHYTHDRLARELAREADAAVAFVNYSLAPEVRYPVPLEETYAAAQWIIKHGAEHGLDPRRLAVAGDSAGGNLAAALTLMVKAEGNMLLAGQVLICPVTDAEFATPSYRQFAEGYYLRRDAMQWYWDQYAPDPAQRSEITVAPLRATTGQLAGLPPALVITAEADVLRDEGEAYAAKLHQAGVPTIATRYRGVLHDFTVRNAIRPAHAAQAAIEQAAAFLSEALGSGRPHT
ncbi:alpha/beta hydrolase [Streptomyces roseoverticillatus]|uniref:alpha/beta hydrolase n=1 Tax=Streptomyces roseoverticillatus TaxID=66429 RepID=UPI0004C2983D|nr:alpha/beta hydrolase [Streptomyces roseoverticillatus]